MAMDQIQWASPSPLWPQAARATDINQRRSVLREPVILRFAADTFMDDFLRLLETDPSLLPQVIAKPETWRGPSAGVAPIKSVPAFARKMSRLGLAAARQKEQALQSTAQSGQQATGLIQAQQQTKPRKLKLYQPAHQRYYLVASSLVCGRAGLPDKTINQGRQERVSFVIRRMFPPGPLNIKVDLPDFNANTWEEYALVSSPSGNVWQRIPASEQANGGILVKNEEQLPLFTLKYSEDDGHKRRLMAGLVPVGKREAYMGAGFRKQSGDPAPVVEPQSPIDSRMYLFWAQVTEPWKKLLEQSSAGSKLKTGNTVPDSPADAPQPKTLSGDSLVGALKTTREQMQTGSWYILLDLANLLIEQAPRVWRLLNGLQPIAGDPPFNFAESTLVTAITNTTFDGSKDDLVLGTSYLPTHVKSSLKDALIAVKAGSVESNLEAVKSSYDRKTPASLWPAFLFPLADPEIAAPLPKLSISAADKDTQLDKDKKKVDALAALIQKALPTTPAAEVPDSPLVSKQPMDMREGWFVMRCVFERPECGPIDPPLLSASTAAFQMAGFFDPDAPARPIRIGLPLDTSPAGLRKFDKNTAFMISDMLCGQIDRLKGLTLGDLVLSVLPWPFHKDLPVGDGGPCTDSGGLEVGMICSLSIPIITICALILLMIIVFLLDIIFRWVPFFLFCFPLPKLKAKT
ncbi:MAG TPA: hypothetical protein VJU86_21270 [Pyrinomonadaceae bacterium]|nr:hypothetical protein [Pyrinomonadaceae bacterium]